MNKQIIVDAVQNAQHIGSYPAVSMKVFAAAGKPDYHLEELCNLVALEPTISAQVLRVSNSVYYSRGVRFTSLVKAVVHLGIENLRRILLAIELIGLYPSKTTVSGFKDSDFWKHSLAGAMLAQELAERSKFADIELCFVSGMLRNIGVPFLRQFFPEKFKAIIEDCEQTKKAFGNSCGDLLGIDHRHIGCLICQNWNLPHDICCSIEGGNKPSEPSSTVSEAIILADAVLAKRQYANWDNYYPTSIRVDLLRKYAIDEEFIENKCGSMLNDIDVLAVEMLAGYDRD
ncbi:MAG: HDOD domain-containing protein [Chitinivibrionales bacterium]|nr:HDOD domain-containing protein [Chitinivibrionales bacterium]MBD3358871.1 HDOD domain-containing protein [Chitinivibrionales bacterium]